MRKNKDPVVRTYTFSFSVFFIRRCTAYCCGIINSSGEKVRETANPNFHFYIVIAEKERKESAFLSDSESGDMGDTQENKQLVNQFEPESCKQLHHWKKASANIA